jgi:hypothetical protein
MLAQKKKIDKRAIFSSVVTATREDCDWAVTAQERHVGREARGEVPRTSGVAQPLTSLGDLARRVPL